MRSLFLLLLTACGCTASVAGELVSGPMLGYQTHREVALWLETRDTQRVELTYSIEGRPDTVKRLVRENPPASPAGSQPTTFVLPLLEMGQAYQYQVKLDGKEVTGLVPFRFKTTTQWEYRTPAPDFSFLFGSCAYLNDLPYDRPGTPYGKGTTIFTHMAKTGADFTLWAGDNWYYREADFSSTSGLWYRAATDRATPDLQALLGSMHHYATWDDHDYGPNDSNKSFPLKGEALKVFQSYWPAQAYGEPDHPGVYQSFTWGDATFIVMDNRYYRDDPRIDEARQPSKSQYGERQREWLKQTLLYAKERRSTFIFVATGGQVITDFGGRSETFELYKNERAEILQFVRDYDIRGVVFLSGDVHFTELARQKMGERWIYELTSSPLTSASWDPSKDKVRAADPQRVEGTLVGDQNFVRVAISGPKGQRQITFECIDKTNTSRWTHVVSEKDIR